MSHTVPVGTQAAMVRRVLNSPHPRIALPTIASNFSVTLAVLQAVLHDAGYPDRYRMERAALRLEELASQAIADRAAAEEAGRAHDPAALPDERTPNGALVPPETSQARRSPDSASTDEPGRLALVRVSDLTPDPRNVRALPSPDAPDIVELADSIAEAGLLQPIVARRITGGRLIIVMGHRRYVAVKRLKWDTVEVIARGPMEPAEVLAAMLIENGQRKDLDPLSEAEGLHQLQRVTGLNEAALGRRIGRSGTWVANRLDLLKLSARDQDRVRAGELGIGAATHAVRSQLGTRQGTAGVDRNWHLGSRHRLAEAARALCDAAGHVTGRRLGGIACGECWEDCIRTDERRKVNAAALAEHDAAAALEAGGNAGTVVPHVPSFVTPGAKPDAW